MIKRLIEDMHKSLDSEAYMAALAIALMLPDICGKAKYPDLPSGERYKKWYKEYIGQYEKMPSPYKSVEFPYLSEEVIYKLRCSLLHSGNPNIDRGEIKEECCKIDRFVIVIEKEKPYAMYFNKSSIAHGEKREYFVNVRTLCDELERAVNKYYKENSEQFSFFDCEILDWDIEVEKHNKRMDGNFDDWFF